MWAAASVRISLPALLELHYTAALSCPEMLASARFHLGHFSLEREERVLGGERHES